MFTADLFSKIPTAELSAKDAYDAYWTVATSESNVIARGDYPVYRFARDYMIRAIMRDYDLTLSQVAWLYEELLPEGPGWGSLDRMVAYGRDCAFGERAKARAKFNCLTCQTAYMEDNEDASLPSSHHALDCPERI